MGARTSITWVILIGGASVALAVPPTAHVGGIVYNDLDRDGVLDPADGRIDVGTDGINLSVVCSVLPSGTAHFDFTESDPDTGEYGFDVTFFQGDQLARCTVGIDPLSQLEPMLEATSPTSVAVELTPEEERGDVHFGLAYRDVLLGDLIWLDEDGDGVPGDGEPGLGSIAVEATCTDTLGDVMTDATETAADGSYTLALPCITPMRMDCTVSVDPAQPLLDGKTATTPTVVELVDLIPGDVVSSVDFGFRGELTGGDAVVSGTVFLDDDIDGTLDAAESGPADNGARVDCLMSDGATWLESQLTADGGGYELVVPIAGGQTGSCEFEGRSLITTFVVPTTATTYSLTLVPGDAVTIDVGFARMPDYPLGNFTSRPQSFFGELAQGYDIMLSLLETGTIPGFGSVLDVVEDLLGETLATPVDAAEFLWELFPAESVEAEAAALALNLGMDSLPAAPKTLLTSFALNVDRVPYTTPIEPPSTPSSPSLDGAGVLLSDLLQGALDITASGAPTVTVGGVTLDDPELREVLALVNVAYDGETTGYVARYDYDPPE